MVASNGDICFGLWYLIFFALLMVVIGVLFVRDPGEKSMDVRHCAEIQLRTIRNTEFTRR
jgi:hypothetical protein